MLGLARSRSNDRRATQESPAVEKGSFCPHLEENVHQPPISLYALRPGLYSLKQEWERDRQTEIQVTVSKSYFRLRNKKRWGLIYLWPNSPKLDSECKLVTWLLVLFCPSCTLWTYSILSCLVLFCLLCLCICLSLFHSLYQGLSQTQNAETPTKLDLMVVIESKTEPE